MKRKFLKRSVLVVCALALVLFLVRPRVGRFRGKVAQAIAQAVGRNVDVSSIHLRLVPRPGFELDNLVVHDDAAFGSEPLLRAPDVTAWLRVGAIFHGRIEIASLSMNEASLNLVRNSAGKWNVEDLVERTAQTSLAPTAAVRYAAIFPYIEAIHTRVNFKIGDEKTHFALTNAEFALWQESQDSWGARLRAAPIRTDLNLTDTGVIDLSGKWERSPAARQTPLQLSFQWKQAQLGQLSRLFYGTDKDWRGAVLISGTAAGTPGDLHLNINGGIDDFRHRDVIGSGNLRLAAHCGGELNLPARAVSSVDCMAPTGAGFLALKGSASGPRSDYGPFSTYDFWLVGSKVPADALLGVARHASAGFHSDISATGEINGSIEISRVGMAQSVRVRGGGAVHDLQLATQNAPVRVGTLPFAVVDRGNAKRAGMPQPKRVPGAVDSIPLENAALLLGPVNVGMGKSAPLQASATVSVSGYAASAKGPGTVDRLLQTASALSIPAPAVSASGDANIDLATAGPWNGPHPMFTGTSELRSVRALVHGLNTPLEITTAHLAIAESAVRVQNLTVQAAGTKWHGSLLIPRPCASAADCAFEFSLHAPAANIADVNALLNPSFAKIPWYKILPFESSQPAYLLRAKASGNLSVDQLALGKAICSDFSTDVKLNSGEVALSNMSGNVLGGHATGNWKATFTKSPPAISGNGTIDKAALADVAQLMRDGWVTGTGSAKYSFSASGKSWPELLASAEMQAEFEVREGTFSHVVLVGSPGPLRTNEFTGKVNFRDGKFSFDEAKLKSAGEVYTVKGTAGLNGILAMHMVNESNSGFNVTGTLFKTVVSPIPTAQAALKP